MAFYQNASAPAPAFSYTLPRPLNDAADVTAWLAAPLSGTGGPNGAGTITPVANPGPAPSILTGPIAVTAGNTEVVRTIVANPHDGSGAEHASPSGLPNAQRGADQGALEWGRQGQRPHRPNLGAMAFLHPGVRPAADPADQSEVVPEPLPSPSGADLIAEALPFVGDSLEGSLDDFVRRLRGEVGGGIVDGDPSPAFIASVAWLGAAASAVMAAEILRRRSSRGPGLRAVDPAGRAFTLSFPELPRSWSEKR